MKCSHAVLWFFCVYAFASGNDVKNATAPKRMVSSTGDFFVGGLVPVHIAVNNKTLCMMDDPNYSFIRSKDGTSICYIINDSGVMWSEALRFAVREVNRLGLLGNNMTLGYDIRDSVNNVDVALDVALDFTTKRRRRSLVTGNRSTHECACPVNGTDPYVVTLIGGARSEISQRVNHVLGVYSLPQISYSSTSVSLSNKKSYRTFLRTIPPDNYQARAMADIAKHFKWNYVATVATDEDYGRRGVTGFHEEAQKLNICISQHSLFHFNTTSQESKTQITNIIRKLKQDKKTNVIVLFCERPRARTVLHEAEKQGMTGKTWIASEDWGFSDKLYTHKESVVGGVLGVVAKTTVIDSFTTYLESLTPQNHNNPWLTEYFERLQYHAKGGMATLNASSLHRNKAAFVMDSVYTVAHALKAYLECKRRGDPECPEKIDLTKLREFMLAVNFTGAFKSTVTFDKEGNPEGKYQISNLQPDHSAVHGKRFVHVGSWVNGKLDFTRKIVWNGRKNETPVSRCAFHCPPGKYYVSTAISCCWECVPCPAGQYKLETGNEQCDLCPTGYISNKNRTQCLRIPEEFIRWDSVASAVLVSLSSFGVLVAMFMFGVYFRYRKSPIVKASSQYPSLLLLIVIAMMFALPMLYIGRPNAVQCHLQPIAFGFLMTFATSLVFTKTFRLIQIFNNVVSNLRDKPLVKVRTQFAIVFFFLVIEAIVIVVYLDQYPIKIRTIIQDSAVPIDCGQSAKLLHVVVLLYNGLLAIICAIMAFRARSLPANFSEARLISFAMFTFSVIWLIFLITFTGSLINNLSTFICVTILATALDLLVCMFGPKIWVILFRPELNEMHVVRADIFRYTMKQRARSLNAHMDSSENELTRSRTYSQPENMSPNTIQDFNTNFQESKL